MKKRYLIISEIKNARGTETWSVKAENETDAITLHDEGKSEFVSQEIEVTGLHEPEVMLDTE